MIVTIAYNETNYRYLEFEEEFYLPLLDPPKEEEVDTILGQFPWIARLLSEESLKELYEPKNRQGFARKCNSALRAVFTDFHKVHGVCFVTENRELGLDAKFFEEIGYFTDYLNSAYWTIEDFRFRLLLRGLPEITNPFIKEVDTVKAFIAKNQIYQLWTLPVDLPEEQIKDFIIERHQWDEKVHKVLPK